MKRAWIFKDICEQGFTLIELTVVVLVILVLMGLAIPRFEAITTAAKQAQCIANIRNLEMAISQWEQKNKAQFPQGWISLTGLGKGGNSSYDLTPYIKDISTFNCPVASRDAGEYYYITPANDKTNKYSTWFPGCNCWYAGKPSNLSDDYPHTTYTADPY